MIKMVGKIVSLWALILLPGLASADHNSPAKPLQQRIDDYLARFSALDQPVEGAETAQQLAEQTGIRVRDCQRYPYHAAEPDPARQMQLLRDIRSALRQGMQCLVGKGPAGYLNVHHEYQAYRLMQILESEQSKTFQCVSDRLYANAVATSPKLPAVDDELYPLMRQTGYPAVILDTYRIGGLLSTSHDIQTYRDFFNLSDSQIQQHLTGHPIRGGDMHRFTNLPALLFHEMVHWLGHEHNAVTPDMAFLYETCCFGGSDYISDAGANSDYQQQACNILKDDELWKATNHKYREMQLWHYKGYDRLKSRMRDDYD